MAKIRTCIVALSVLALWQSASLLMPHVVSIILQLLNLGGGGLNFITLMGLVAGVVLGQGLDLGLGLTGLIVPPAVLVFVL